MRPAEWLQNVFALIPIHCFCVQLKSQNRETTEDMSDSGVMSLATSDDFCSDGDQHENELVSPF
jgi:hypothetical protein